MFQSLRKKSSQFHSTAARRATTMAIDKLLSECRDLALSIAPELDSQPLYFLEARELAGLPCGRRCLGWAGGDIFFDHAIADRLGSRYLGPGRIISLDLAAIRAAAQPGAFERCAHNVTLHEIAHLLPVRTVLEPPDTARVRELQALYMDRAWEAPLPEPGGEDDSHDWRFCRRCIHLFVRAAALGWDIPLFQLFGTSLLTAHAEFYLPPLLPEALRMRFATFAEIEAASPAQAILDVWKCDLDRNKQIFGKRK